MKKRLERRYMSRQGKGNGRRKCKKRMYGARERQGKGREIREGSKEGGRTK